MNINWRALASTTAGRVKAAGGAVRASVRRHHRGWAEGGAALLMALATLSLSDSTGAAHGMGPGASVRGSGEWLSDAQLRRISANMSPYAAELADRIGRGRQGWTPTGIEGWNIYDLSAPASVIQGQLSYDDARAFNALIRPSGFDILPMKTFAVKDQGDYASALQCLTQAVYYEAAVESDDGQQAVAQVVLNRVQHPAYPNSVCGVVYQGSQRVTGCQFSFTCDGSLAREPMADSWNRAKAVAEKALKGAVYEGVGTATHYHADYVLPYWAVTLVKLKQIGAHIFYRMTGPAGSPNGFSARYAGNETVIDPSILRGGDARTPDAPTVIDAALMAEESAEPRTVTLTTGGETRTYIVGDAPNIAPPALTVSASSPAVVGADLGARGREPSAVGTLTPTRRMPTPDEIRQINERLMQMQMGGPSASALSSVTGG